MVYHQPAFGCELAYFAPRVNRYFGESLDDERIEVRPRAPDQFFARIIKRTARAVWSIRSHRVYGIGYREDPRAQAYLIALDAIGIAASVVAFVMLSDDFSSALKKIYSLKYLRADLDVPAHIAPLVFGQRAALQQYSIGNAVFSDVVKQRAVLQRHQLAIIQPNLSSEPNAVGNYPVRVASRLDVSGFQGGSQRSQRCTIVRI